MQLTAKPVFHLSLNLIQSRHTSAILPPTVILKRVCLAHIIVQTNQPYIVVIKTCQTLITNLFVILETALDVVFGQRIGPRAEIRAAPNPWRPRQPCFMPIASREGGKRLLFMFIYIKF